MRMFPRSDAIVESALSCQSQPVRYVDSNPLRIMYLSPVTSGHESSVPIVQSSNHRCPPIPPGSGEVIYMPNAATAPMTCVIDLYFVRLNVSPPDCEKMQSGLLLPSTVNHPELFATMLSSEGSPEPVVRPGEYSSPSRSSARHPSMM